MQTTPEPHGKSELWRALRPGLGLLCAVALFSLFANLLLLAGPIYMLQVYDRVLASGSVETLVSLSVILAFLYALWAVLDLSRSRITTRVAVAFEKALEPRVFSATLRKSAVLPDALTANSLNDLTALRRLIASPVVAALFDAPWTPIFFLGIFVLHPQLGWLALAGGGVLVGIALANQLASRGAQREADAQDRAASLFAAQIRTDAQTVQGVGMQDRVLAYWRQRRHAVIPFALVAQDTGDGFRALTRSLRMMLQSAMLGFGAWLVIGGQMTPGGMVAGSILLGRALAPVETMVAQWPLAQSGLQGWRNLAHLLSEVRPERAQTTLPAPQAELSVNQLTVAPPGQRLAALRSVSFDLSPGQGLGVIGPSGSGKTALARALVGIWPAAAGTIRLNGAALSQYGPADLGRHIGYLPQRIDLFDGTIAQNIAGFDPDSTDAAVVSAAKMAAVHDMIVALPMGYDTPVVHGQTGLSGGQVQRIGLARAFYTDPVLLLLDEPNAHLDNAGSVALNKAVQNLKERGGAVLIMAHRPAAIQECDLLMILDAGTCTAFGPKATVLSERVRNGAQINVTSLGAKGAA